MEFDILWRTPHKRLGNLPNVVKRLTGPWYEEKVSPRRLLFGLFVLYQNTKKEIRNLKSYIDYLNKRNDQLHNRIKELVEYEKKSSMLATRLK